MALKLNPAPDAYGFLYGTYTRSDGEIVDVNIMPPAHAWSGDMKLDGYEPHGTDWIVFANGEEIARTSAEHGIAGAIVGRLTDDGD